MAKKQVKTYIIVDDEYFTGEKTNDVFKEVEFSYQTKQWQGALPKFLEKQGLDLTDEEFDILLEENYQLLEPTNTQQWIVESDIQWKNKNSETYKVLAALYVLKERTAYLVTRKPCMIFLSCYLRLKVALNMVTN